MHKRSLHPRYIQIGSSEAQRLDYAQARAVLKHKPDMILFEFAGEGGTPDTQFNHFPPEKKPYREAERIVASLRKEGEKIKQALSDVRMWESVIATWRSGHDMLLYNVDGPRDLRREFLTVWENCYPSALRNWLWWVRIYLREAIMAKHIRWALTHYKGKHDPTVLVFLEKFHWIHVKFLLTNPTKRETWNYYFKRFEKRITRRTIGGKIKRESAVFYKYWKLHSL